VKSYFALFFLMTVFLAAAFLGTAFIPGALLAAIFLGAVLTAEALPVSWSTPSKLLSSTAMYQ
jgi:hypothetical protein